MKISLRFKHVTTVFAPPSKTEAQSVGLVNVVYSVMDATTAAPLVCKSGRYAGAYIDSYVPSDDEETIIYQLQKLAETRYSIRSRPVPDASGQAVFEAVRTLRFERELGEIEWEAPSPTFAAVIEENAALELDE